MPKNQMGKNNKKEVDEMALPAVKITRLIDEPSIEEMERILGLDKIAPIQLSESDLSDRDEDVDYFEDWYREELKKLYAQHIKESGKRLKQR